MGNEGKQQLTVMPDNDGAGRLPDAMAGGVDQYDAPKACLTVYHDGSCALCQREIALARSIDGANSITFKDVSDLDPHDRVDGELTASAAMRRFHVRRADGTLVSGAAAFIEMWSVSPRLRFLKRIGDSHFAVASLDVLYGVFLRIRPPLSAALGRYDAWRSRRSR